MTDKQIIIDDCIHLNEWKHCDICEKLIKTKDGANGKKREHLLTEEDLRCDFYPNCYYKQLKRKEQECEELKESVSELITMKEEDIKRINNAIKLKQTLTEIKDFFKEECLICKENYINIIGEICKECRYQDILRKINEVE